MHVVIKGWSHSSMSGLRSAYRSKLNEQQRIPPHTPKPEPGTVKEGSSTTHSQV